MELSKFAICEIAPYIFGKNGIAKNRTGNDLVKLFNKYGFRDVYDFENGGLPKLNNKTNLNTTKTEYTKDRLLKLSGADSLRELLEEIINEPENNEIIRTAILEIIQPEGYTIIEEHHYFKIIGGTIEKKINVKNDVKFRDIQDTILKELDNAQVSISLAMAWFSNEILLSKLKEKKEEGVRVEIVIYDDGVNKRTGVDLSGFDYIKVRGQRGGIMHNKFCVIDNQVILHGSYNWSNNAEYRNDETLQVSRDPNLATEFSVEFRNLRNGKG